jgi:large conductance mechanosensitive channel
MLDEFKKFLFRGNIVDLAVAVVIGAAFTRVVQAFTDGIVNPLVGLIAGQNFDTLTITLVDPDFGSNDPGVVLGYGFVITAALNFVIVAAVIFFLVVKPLNALAARRAAGEEPAEDEPAPSDEALLLTEIRDLLAQRTS